MKRILAILWLFALSLPALAGEAVTVLSQDSHHWNIPRVQHPPTLHQFLEGKPREKELVVSDFRQRDPRDGNPVSLPTTAYLSYDDKNLYAVFVCKDDPAKVRAHLSKRDSQGGDDLVGIVLDTFHDNRRAYMFMANPLGVQSDSIVAEGLADDYAYDTVWHSEGAMTADGFVIYLAIPFRSLRFARRPMQDWGIMLARFIPRLNESAFYPHVTRRVAGTLQQTATLSGIENVAPGRNMQFIPYVYSAHARELDTSVPAFSTHDEFRGGLDGKMVLHNALTFDFTVNPDFSQVESDEPQVTANQRYEVYFPEHRPFFIENADFFRTSTPEMLFFSRRIIDPEFGGRLTGSFSRWKVAALVVDDRAAGQTAGLEPGDPDYTKHALVSIARVRREFARQAGIGVVFTTREFAGSYNRLASMDLHLPLDKHWTFIAQAIATNTRFLDGSYASGPAYNVQINYASRTWNLSSTYLDRSPNFYTDVGYVTRNDIRKESSRISYAWRPKRRRKLLCVTTQLNGFVDWNHAGQMADWDWHPEVQFEFPRQTYIGMNMDRAFELFDGIGFREHWTAVWANTAPWKEFSLNTSYYRGRGLNYYPGGNTLPFSDLDESGSAGVTVRPTSNLQITESYIWYHVATLNGLAPAGYSGGSNVFNNHIARSKVNWQFNRRLSVRAIGDYNALLPNSELYNDVARKRLTGDLLVTYMINPWTALYVGYTDNFENLNLDPRDPGYLMRTRSPTISTGRQVFAKFSYLFRF